MGSILRLPFRVSASVAEISSVHAVLSAQIIFKSNSYRAQNALISASHAHNALKPRLHVLGPASRHMRHSSPAGPRTRRLTSDN